MTSDYTRVKKCGAAAEDHRWLKVWTAVADCLAASLGSAQWLDDVTPTTAGKPYSRAITAPWVIRPPTSVTSPSIETNRGVQLGSVQAVTRIGHVVNGERAGAAAVRTIVAASSRRDAQPSYLP